MNNKPIGSSKGPSQILIPALWHLRGEKGGKSMTYQEGIRKFYFYLKGNNHALSTAQTYRAILERYQNQGQPIEEITFDDLQNFISTFHLSVSSMNQIKASIRGLFKFLVESDLLNKNPSLLLKLEPVPVQEARYLSTAEVRKFLDAVKSSPRDNLLFQFYLNTGLRLNELLSLNIADLRGKKVIEIKGKRGKVRKVYLPKPLFGLIKDHIKNRDDHAPLFLSGQHRRLHCSTVYEMTRTYCKRAGIKNTYSPHSLRHTFLTEVYRRTKDLRLVQELAGHSNPAMTARYAHVDRSAKIAAVQGLYQ